MRRMSFLFAVTALMICGCETSRPTSATSPATPVSAAAHAECMVCKMNVDLACIDVAVEKDTPHSDYNGKTYYFCSEECKARFAKNPAKYASSN